MSGDVSSVSEKLKTGNSVLDFAPSLDLGKI